MKKEMTGNSKTEKFMLSVLTVLAIALVLLLVLVSCAAHVNTNVDSTREYMPLERQVVKRELNGDDTKTKADIDSRIKNYYYFNDSIQKRDTLILGSSRSSYLNSEIISNNKTEKVYNTWVAGASIEDYYNILGMAYENKLLPNKVVIEISPWMFNDNSKEERWKDLSQYFNGVYGEMISKHDRPMNIDHDEIRGYKPSDVASLTLLSDNIKKIMKDDYSSVKRNDLGTIDESKANYWYLGYEGNQYPAYRTIDVSSRIERLESGLARKNIYFQLSKFNKIGEQKKYLFNIMLDWLDRKDIEVEFYIAGFPQPVYKRYEKERNKIFSKVESMLRDIAEERNYSIRGSYSPNKLGLKKEDFLDATHYSYTVVKQIWGYKES